MHPRVSILRRRQPFVPSDADQHAWSGTRMYRYLGIGLLGLSRQTVTKCTFFVGSSPLISALPEECKPAHASMESKYGAGKGWDPPRRTIPPVSPGPAVLAKGGG